jgi:putative membrane protein
MIITALVVAAVAALIHVYIFVLESVLWTTPRARATFGLSEQQAKATAPMAFNQGFYNLFLALSIAVGIVLIAVGAVPAGAALVFAGAGSMVLAGLVLVASDRSKARPALIQLVPPLVAVVLLTVGLAAG